MPFVSVYRPSLQLGLLKALAADRGFHCDTLHLNIDFAARIGTGLYEQFVHHRGRMFGDWLFSLAAFGTEAPDQADRLPAAFPAEVQMLLRETQLSTERIIELRRRDVPAFIDGLVADINWAEFDVVGFTSTFQQNVASFALAARIKARCPHIITLFGGSNFEGSMGLELVRSINCVDYAVIGEADDAFPDFLCALREGRDPSDVAGVVTRREGAVTELRSHAPTTQLDALPTPDYDEYFTRAIQLGVIPDTARRLTYLPFESSRGCWWGQKHHCTFCGLNGSVMKYRPKSAERVLAELGELAHRYHSYRFEAVDNIVDMSFFKSLFPRIVSESRDYEFFYEVKSNLTKEKLGLLRSGGVRRIQPGIESLNSHVLRLMRKGVTAIQNVNTLRWAKHHGLDVGWNIIWGFPGETEDDYADQLRLMSQLVHLQPPTGAGRIWMERFSPLFADRQTFPASFVKPEASYSYVYPPQVELEQIAYFFDYELEGRLGEELYEDTRDAVSNWQAAWRAERPPTLTFWSSPHLLQVEDVRWPDRYGTYTFPEPLASLYAACSDQPASPAGLQTALGLDDDESEIADALREFCRLGLMMQEHDQFLALALPASRWR